MRTSSLELGMSSGSRSFSSILTPYRQLLCTRLRLPFRNSIRLVRLPPLNNVDLLTHKAHTRKLLRESHSISSILPVQFPTIDCHGTFALVGAIRHATVDSYDSVDLQDYPIIIGSPHSRGHSGYVLYTEMWSLLLF